MDIVSYPQRKPRPLALTWGILPLVLVLVLLVFHIGLAHEKTDLTSTLRIGKSLEPTNLDIRNTSGVALEQILIDNVYQGLVGLKPQSVDTIIPVLAEEMPSISEDRCTYTFKLRSGIRFHSGHLLTTSDVVSSLQQTLTEKVLKTQVEIFSPGQNLVQIKLAEPNRQLLWQLASRKGLIFEQDDPTDLTNQTNGTGPYRLGEWKINDSLSLERNPNYWGSPPAISTVVFKFIPFDRRAVNALKQGDIDVYTTLMPALRAAFTNDPNFEITRAKSTDVFTLAYNLNYGPLADLRVRQAISQAIDPEAIIKTQNGDGSPLGSPITELEPGYIDLTQINSYDPENAKRLLAEAGYEDLTLTLSVPNHYETTVLQLLTSELAEVGITLEIDSLEFSTWLDRVYTKHDYQLSYVDHAEARDFENYTREDYYFNYQNPQVNQLYQQSLRAGSDQEEAQLLAQAQTLVAQDAPAAWLYNYTPSVVYSTRVNNFPVANSNSRIPLAEITLLP